MGYPETYLHDDHDGGTLTVDPADKHNAGIWIEADCFVSLANVPALVEAIWTRAQQSAHKLGKLPCPHPDCGPCSFDRAIPAVVQEPSSGRRTFRLTDEHLSHVAGAYRSALFAGQAPTLAVASRFGVPHSTAAKWVAKARQASLLGETTRGQAGEQR